MQNVTRRACIPIVVVGLRLGQLSVRPIHKIDSHRLCFAVADPEDPTV